jgi:hypothetical protein
MSAPKHGWQHQHISRRRTAVEVQHEHTSGPCQCGHVELAHASVGGVAMGACLCRGCTCRAYVPVSGARGLLLPDGA